jgi:hypothetical protein
MRQVPQADYDFMAAFGEIVIEGVVDLVKGVLGVAEDAAEKSPELKKHINKAKNKAGVLTGKKQAASTTDSESISQEDWTAARNAKLMPQIKRVSQKPEADRRFDWYEKKGFLSECWQQRQERLNGD